MKGSSVAGIGANNRLKSNNYYGGNRSKKDGLTSYYGSGGKKGGLNNHYGGGGIKNTNSGPKAGVAGYNPKVKGKTYFDKSKKYGGAGGGHGPNHGSHSGNYGSGYGGSHGPGKHFAYNGGKHSGYHGGNHHGVKYSGHSGKYFDHYKGKHGYHGGNYYGNHHHHHHYWRNYGGGYGYYPFNNFFFLGGYGLGYSYWGRGFGLSIGLPFCNYYNSFGYYDYYNVAQPYYVSSQPYYAEPAIQPYYTDYITTTDLTGQTVGLVETSVTEPVVEPIGDPLAEPVAELLPEPETEPVSDGEQIQGESIIPTEGLAIEFQARAEQAFKEGRYLDAAKLSNHALIEDGENGKLHLFASQVLFALGDYRSSAAAIQRAAAVLDRNEWGFVVENFKKFYRGKDYVTQMDELVKFIKENPEAPFAHFLRGYHYLYLGHKKAAQAPLTRAVELERRDRLAAELLLMAGGKVPENAEPAAPPAGESPAATPAAEAPDKTPTDPDEPPPLTLTEPKPSPPAEPDSQQPTPTAADDVESEKESEGSSSGDSVLSEPPPVPIESDPSFNPLDKID